MIHFKRLTKPHKHMLMLTVADIAKMAGVHADTIRKRAAARNVAPLKMVGRVPLYSPDDAKILLIDIGRGWNAKRVREAATGHRKAS